MPSDLLEWAESAPAPQQRPGAWTDLARRPVVDDRTAARFNAKVQRSGRDECWLWISTVDAYGYGRFYFRGRFVQAHRFSYEAAIGPIPSRLVIDHLCRNKGCVNPRHLEPVTNRQNGLRGNVRHNASKSHCPRGHPYNAANTYTSPTGWRECRACRRSDGVVPTALSQHWCKCGRGFPSEHGLLIHQTQWCETRHG